MTPCPCTTEPSEHQCLWVLPWQAAALAVRPVETIRTWRKNGTITSKRTATNRWKVCLCETLQAAGETATTWKQHADRKVATGVDSRLN